MKKASKNIDLDSTNRIIEMAWEDRTPFEVIEKEFLINHGELITIMSCLLYTSPSPRDTDLSRMPSSA